MPQRVIVEHAPETHDGLSEGETERWRDHAEKDAFTKRLLSKDSDETKKNCGGQAIDKR